MSAAARMSERLRALPGSARARRLLRWLAGGLLVVAVLGFFVAPPLVRSQAEKALGEKLRRPVSIENVRVNPFAPSLTVQGLSVKERDGSAVAAGFEELYVRLSYTSIFRFAPVVSALRLTRPSLQVTRRADRSYNFQDLIDEALAPAPAPAEPAQPLRFSVNNIEIDGGRLAFDDAVAGEKHEVTDIRLGVPFFSSLPSQVDIDVQPELSARVNGAPLAIKGETHPFKDTNETTVDVNLDALSLPKLADYSPVPLRFVLESGSLDTRIRVRFVTRGAKAVGLTASGTAGLSKLSIRDAAGSPLVAFERFAADIESIDVFGREAKVRNVRLEKPTAAVVRAKDGKLNLLEALPAAPAPEAAPKTEVPPAAEAKAFRFSVEDIAITAGQVSLADLSVTPRPFRTELGAIEVGIRQLANHGGRRAQVTASFATDGLGAFRHEGSLQLAPIVAEGKVSGEGFRLARIYPYLEPILNLDIADGTAAFEAGYALALGETLDLKVSGASASASTIVLRYPGEKDAFVRLPHAQLRDVSADLSKRQVVVGEVLAKGGVVNAHRVADGTLKFARLLKEQAVPAASAKEPAKAGAAASEWRIDLKRSVIEGFAATFTDEVPQPPVVVKVTRFRGLAENWSNAPGTRSTVRVGATVNGTGTVSARGPVTMSPFAAELDVEAKRLEFAFAQPYLEPRTNLALTSGALTARGRVLASAPAGGPFNAAFKGDVTIGDFASVDRVSREDFANWRSLHVGGIDFALSPLKAHVGEVALSDFYARIILSAAGRLNLADVMREAGDEAKSLTDTELRRVRPDAGAPTGETAKAPDGKGPESPAKPPADIRIGRVVLQGGQVAFSDFFVRPNYTADLKAIGGSVSEMTAQKAGVVELSARLDGTAPVEAAGRINALSSDLLVDLAATARDIELPAFSPYAIKYAGYGIERGKLSVRLKYLVENRKLAAENNVFLDQLTFGPKVESPTATKLPVLLAVSLLKDRNGVIDIDLPISGSIDDPQFSVWGIIGRVIVNLIAKAATAPFALLGAAFGGGGEELAYLEFAPGRARLEKAGTDKLAAIAKALGNRPGLKLDIAGRADPATDTEALRALSLERAVKAEKAKSLSRDAAKPASLDEIEVTKEEYSRFLTAAYKEAKFTRPRNFIGMLKDLPVAEMESLMRANAPVGDEELRSLATARALAAKDWLVGPGAVPPERVFLVAPRLGVEAIKDKGRPNRVDFALK